MAKSPVQFRRMALLSAASVGGILMIFDLLAISTVGPEIFSRSFFPLMTTFHMVNIGDFVQNIDPLIVTNYMVGVLFKVSIFTYAACAMISGLWKVPGHKAAVIPVSIIILFFALYMAENLSSHLFTGHQWATWIIFPPFFIVMPLLVLLIIKIKTAAGKGGG
jgi:spore germination protein KB